MEIWTASTKFRFGSENWVDAQIEAPTVDMDGVQAPERWYSTSHERSVQTDSRHERLEDSKLGQAKSTAAIDHEQDVL